MIGWSAQRDDAEGVWIDMRSTAERPWNRLSPDYQHGQIPVPGIKGMYSETCRGCFEGLKLTGKPGFPAHMNIGYYGGPGRERALRPNEYVSGWYYRGRPIGLHDARLNIEIPTYQWMLRHTVPELTSKLRVLSRVQNVWLWDDRGNVDLNDPAPLSYAALLCAVMLDDVASFRRGEFTGGLI